MSAMQLQERITYLRAVAQLLSEALAQARMPVNEHNVATVFGWLGGELREIEEHLP